MQQKVYQNYPEHTFAIKLVFKDPSLASAHREMVGAFLHSIGCLEFVETEFSDLDIDFEYGSFNEEEIFNGLESSLSPLVIYKYSKEGVDEITSALNSKFQSEIFSLSIHKEKTSEWLEGWKDQFKPIFTETLVVCAPWHNLDLNNSSKKKILIEPGMAFGTGQHATTKLCLEALSDLYKEAGLENFSKLSFLDVGTGTGVLAIAAMKLGAKNVLATDIDRDALLSCSENQLQNNVNFPLLKTSVPTLLEAKTTFDIVVANILSSVLSHLLNDLKNSLKDHNSKLILSGILENEAEDFSAKAANFGLNLNSQKNLDGWTCLSFNL